MMMMMLMKVNSFKLSHLEQRQFGISNEGHVTRVYQVTQRLGRSDAVLDVITRHCNRFNQSKHTNQSINLFAKYDKTASIMNSGGRTTRQLNVLTVALEKTQVKSN